MASKERLKRERTDDEHPNTRPTKRAKENWGCKNYFETLHEELIVNILLLIPIEQFADLAVVCKLWGNQLAKQEFWRRFVYEIWKSSLPAFLGKDTAGSGIDRLKLVIPTYKVGNRELVDWRRYVKIRVLLFRANTSVEYFFTRAVPDQPYGEDEDGADYAVEPDEDEDQVIDLNGATSSDRSSIGDQSEMDSFLPKLVLTRSNMNDLTPVNVLYCLHKMAENSFGIFYRNRSYPEKLKLVVHPVIELAFEVLPLFMERGLLDEAKVITQALENHFTGLDTNRSEYYALKYYEASQVMREYPMILCALFSLSCKMFSSISAWSASLEKLFKNLLKQMLDFADILTNYQPSLDEEYTSGGKDNLQELSFNMRKSMQQLYDEGALLRRGITHEFLYPLQEITFRAVDLGEPLKCIIHQSSVEADRCCRILADFIVGAYHSSNNPKVQAMAMAMSEISDYRPKYLTETLVTLACTATQHEHDGVKFAAYTLLWKFASSFGLWCKEKGRLLKIVDFLIDAMDKHAARFLILTHTITQILEKNASIITDKKLDLLNKKILTCLNSEFGYDKLFDYETKRAYDELWRLGEVFKERLAKYLPDYKAAIQKIARCKPPEGWNDKIWGREIYPEQLLDQYIQLGYACQDSAFDRAASDFTKHVLTNYNEYDVRESQFFALFGDKLLKNPLTKTEVVHSITSAILDLCDEKILAWANTTDALSTEVSEELWVPWNFAQFKALQEIEYRADDCSQLTVSVAPDYFRSPSRHLEVALSEADLRLAKITATEQYCTHEEISEWIEIPEIKRATQTLMKFRDIVPDDLVQKTLHLMLAHHKVTHNIGHLEAAYDLYVRLKPELAPYHRDYYIAIMLDMISTPKKELANYKHRYHSVYTQLVEHYLSNTHYSYSVAYWFLRFSLNFGTITSSQECPKVALNFLRRLLEKCPRAAKEALDCAPLSYLFDGEGNDKQRFVERMIMVAFIAYYFGIEYAETKKENLSGALSVNELCEKAIEHLHQNPFMDTKTHFVLTRFVVLTKLSQRQQSYSQLSLFTAIYLKPEKLEEVLALVHSDTFTTGSKDIDEEVNSWKFVFGFEKL